MAKGRKEGRKEGNKRKGRRKYLRSSFEVLPRERDIGDGACRVVFITCVAIAVRPVDQSEGVPFGHREHGNEHLKHTTVTGV